VILAAMTVQDIPPLNATLNAIATVLMTAGFVVIKRAQRAPDVTRRAALIRTHRTIMLSSAVVSALFLVGYLTYHGMRRGLHTPFGGTGAIRTVYLTILWTHIPLAALIAFLVPRTFAFALQGQFDRHRAWARWTFPIWYYVSVTGVLVYLFLYQWWPAA
jgi:putative membrane protein